VSIGVSSWDLSHLVEMVQLWQSPDTLDMAGSTTAAALADLGVRRISVGGGLARVAWGAAIGAATEITEQGTFTGLTRGIPFADIDDTFKD
jgi:2-methylisocitrate lyase-like PEP mutase family enzyme